MDQLAAGSRSEDKQEEEDGIRQQIGKDLFRNLPDQRQQGRRDQGQTDKQEYQKASSIYSNNLFYQQIDQSGNHGQSAQTPGQVIGIMAGVGFSENAGKRPAYICDDLLEEEIDWPVDASKQNLRELSEKNYTLLVNVEDPGFGQAVELLHHREFMDGLRGERSIFPAAFPSVHVERERCEQAKDGYPGYGIEQAQGVRCKIDMFSGFGVAFENRLDETDQGQLIEYAECDAQQSKDQDRNDERSLAFSHTGHVFRPRPEEDGMPCLEE
jgi:hypothetical protein